MSIQRTINLCILCVSLAAGAVHCYTQYAIPEIRVARGLGWRPPGTGGPRSVVLYDTCRSLAWCLIGSQLWNSSDKGQSWQRVELPLKGAFLYHAALYMDGCKVVCQWDNKVFDNQYRLTVLQDTSWSMVANPLDVWTPDCSSTMIDSMVVVGPDLGDEYSLSLSWNGGKTWQDIEYPNVLVSNYEDWLSKPHPDRVAVIRTDSSVMEFLPSTKEIRLLSVPAQTVRYSYFDTVHVISFQARNFYEPSTVALSSDGGKTWKKESVIKTASGEQISQGGQDSLHARWIRTRGDGSGTVIFSSGLIASTADYGHSWNVNGWIPQYSMILGNGMNIVSVLANGTMYVSAGTKIYKLSSGSDTLKLQSTTSPNLLALCALDDSNLIGLMDEGIVYSTDAGVTWLLSRLPLEQQRRESDVGPHDSYIERVVCTNNRTYFYCPGSQAVLSTNGTDLTIEYRSYLNIIEYFRCDDDRNSTTGQRVSMFDGHTVTGAGESFINKYSKQYTPSENIPSALKGPFYYHKLDNGDEYLFADSLYIRFSGSSDWITTLTGLPADGKHKLSASSLVQMDDGKLICGLRGYQYSDADTATVQGGIWQSTDKGLSWSALDLLYPFNPYVWHVVRSADETLYASVSMAMGSTAGSTLYSSQSHILRSTDKGTTWSSVYTFNDLQRIITGSGHRLAANDRGQVTALGDRLVVYSADRGNTWVTVEDNFDPTICLSDVAFDSTGAMWVGSSGGAFRFASPSTSVTGGDDRLRYTSVWLYPTPTKGTATIRLNNTDLIDVTQCSLVLYDQFGGIRADLTPLLRSARSQARYEFTFDTGNLESGLYVLALKEPNRFVERYKMLVIH